MNAQIDNQHAAIEVAALKTVIGGRVIHADLHLQVPEGQVMGIVGASGSGKSLLLQSLIGLRRPEAGIVKLLGQDIYTISPAVRRDLLAQTGVLFQDGALFSGLTVAQNIQAPLREIARLSGPILDEIATLKLALVGLPADAGAKLPHQLSGGMRKRAGLARSLAMDPKVLFLDEPTAGLDPIAAAAFDDLIRTLQTQTALTVLLVTHDIDTLYSLCDRVAVLADRQIVAVDETRQLRHAGHPWLQQYFDGPRGRAAYSGYASSPLR